MTTTAYPGYGSSLASSPNGSAYTTIAQLKKFAPVGSKQTMVDQTNITTPLPFTQPYAARVDSGEFELSGVLNPSEATALNLGTLHAGLTLAYFQVTLTDGSVYTFQAFVSEYVPFDVTYNKMIGFSAKLRVQGAITGPAGAA